MSYYTCRLANAFAEQGQAVSAILMRRLIPSVLYPGRARVGEQVNNIDYAPNIDVFNGVDWSSPLSLFRAIRFLRAHRPKVVILQWWTGAVLHSYLLLARTAKRCGATVVVEFHETQDTGETRIPFAVSYHRRIARAVLSWCDSAVVHSEYDREQVHAHLPVAGLPVDVVPHGPFDHHVEPTVPSPRQSGDALNLLFFGTIRPYKGLEHLVQAFDAMDEDEVAGYRLTIVGETWEGWTQPLDLVAACRHRDRITVVNRYVHDDEVASFFADADAVVLPYLRSSASGPLHIAMAAGLPVIVTDVGGLRTGAGDYGGAVWVPPATPDALKAAILGLPARVGRRYEDVRSWDETVAAFRELAASCA